MFTIESRCLLSFWSTYLTVDAFQHEDGWGNGNNNKGECTPLKHTYTFIYHEYPTSAHGLRTLDSLVDVILLVLLDTASKVTSMVQASLVGVHKTLFLETLKQMNANMFWKADILHISRQFCLCFDNSYLLTWDPMGARFQNTASHANLVKISETSPEISSR